MANERILKIALAEKDVVAAAVAWGEATCDSAHLQMDVLIDALVKLREVKERA